MGTVVGAAGCDEGTDTLKNDQFDGSPASIAGRYANVYGNLIQTITRGLSEMMDVACWTSNSSSSSPMARQATHLGWLTELLSRRRATVVRPSVIEKIGLWQVRALAAIAQISQNDQLNRLAIHKRTKKCLQILFSSTQESQDMRHLSPTCPWVQSGIFWRLMSTA